MFVKKSWNTKGKKRYICYEIAVSYRPKNAKYPRTKTIANITHLPKPIIEKIALLLKSPNSSIVDLDGFFKRSYIFGPVVFLYLFMKRLKIIECLKSIPIKSRILIIAVIINRILEARSKLGSVSWIKKTAFPIIFGIEKNKLVVNQVYKAMDVLYRKMEEVTDRFFKENKGQTMLLFYDITSVFFEGYGPEGMANYGYSRDKRPDRRQILLCLCLNEEKLPIYFDIIEGNIQDKKTVKPLVEELKKRYQLKEAIFIGDRGMVEVENVEFLKGEGIDYIVALTHREARKIIFKEGIQLELFDKELPVKIHTERGKKYVLCGSKYRKERDELLLKHILEKGREGLEKVRKMVEDGRLKDREKVIRRAQKKLTESGCENYYDFRYEDGVFEIIEKRSFIEKAKALCGYYILETTKVEMEDKEVERHYKGLKFVEEAFRELKDIVEIRPIFHWKERRVRVHIFLCILAQVVVNKIKDRLKEKGWLNEEKGNSFSHFLDVLYQNSLGIFEIEGKEEKIITKLTQEMKEYLEMFDMEERYFTRLALADELM